MWFDCDRAGFETALAPDYMQVGLLARSEPELPCVDFARLAVVGAIEYSDRVCVDLIVLLDILNLDPIFFSNPSEPVTAFWFHASMSEFVINDSEWPSIVGRSTAPLLEASLHSSHCDKRPLLTSLN